MKKTQLIQCVAVSHTYCLTMKQKKKHFLEIANKYVYEGNIEWESINEGRNSVELKKANKQI